MCVLWVLSVEFVVTLVMFFCVVIGRQQRHVDHAFGINERTTASLVWCEFKSHNFCRLRRNVAREQGGSLSFLAKGLKGQKTCATSFETEPQKHAPDPKKWSKLWSIRPPKKSEISPISTVFAKKPVFWRKRGKREKTRKNAFSRGDPFSTLFEGTPHLGGQKNGSVDTRGKKNNTHGHLWVSVFAISWF